METINRHHYPELNKLLWDVHTTHVTQEDAYRCYEQRWQFVDQNIITQVEKVLIEKLKNTVGNGLFMPANH